MIPVFDEHADGVTPIGSGMFSQAYAFVSGQREYVARVSACLEDFQKDAFAAAHFVSSSLPIPRVVRIDRYDATRYVCITERCAGRTLKDTHNASDKHLVPHLFATLDAIHSTRVSHLAGWGLADAYGRGRFGSWTESLLALYNQKFEYDWAAIARTSFFDKHLFDEFFAEMQRRLPYCPAERYLIHRDYGFDNVMTDGARITGVLDWAEFGYGDFLYDVAYLDYYSQSIAYGDLWRARARSLGRAVPNFDERMECYMLNIGLHGMAIAVTLGNERAYIRERERTRSVLMPGRRAQTDWTQ